MIGGRMASVPASDCPTERRTIDAATRWRLRFFAALSEQLRSGFWSAPNRGVAGTVAASAFLFQVPCYEVVFTGFTVAKWDPVLVKNPVDANALFVKFPARLTDLE
jgi:hypothetical protein